MKHSHLQIVSTPILLVGLASNSDSFAGSGIRIGVCIDSGGAVCGPTANQQRVPGDI